MRECSQDQRLQKVGRKDKLGYDKASAESSTAPTGHSGVQMVLQLVQVGVRGLGFVLLC